MVLKEPTPAQARVYLLQGDQVGKGAKSEDLGEY